MRDDVKKIFNVLLTHLDEKIRYTNNLLENVKQISCLIDNRRDNEDDILKIINQNNNLIDKINIQDFNISHLKDEVSRRYSLDLEKIFRDPLYISETEILECRKKILHLKDLTRQITCLNQQNSNDMINEIDDLKQQISELNRMSRLSLIFPGENKL